MPGRFNLNLITIKPIPGYVIVTTGREVCFTVREIFSEGINQPSSPDPDTFSRFRMRC